MKLFPTIIVVRVTFHNEMISEQMRTEIHATLKNNDELIDETTTIDSSQFTRYIYKIKTRDSERLKRSLTTYKLQHLDLDFIFEEERVKIIKLASKTEPILQYLKNLFYPIKAQIFFKINERYTIMVIINLFENPITGITKNVPESSVIHNTENWHTFKIKIFNETDFSLKMTSFKNENPNIEIFSIFKKPTIKTYSWLIATILTVLTRTILDLLS